MALFAVSRFTGDSVDLGLSRHADSEKEAKILENLKRKAAERRKQRQLKLHKEEVEDETSKHDKSDRKSRKRKVSESSNIELTDSTKELKTEDSASQAEADNGDEQIDKAEKGVAAAPRIEGATDVGDFCILGEYAARQKKKVRRVLPDWLAHPSVVSADIQRQGGLPVSKMEGLDAALQLTLQENGISHFFPVQAAVLPELLWQLEYGYSVGRGGIPPSDLCVSAPTGSGKTLVFVLPIVQALRRRSVAKVRALAVLPVQDLANQVYQVFHTYAEPFGLKVKLITGQATFEKEQKKLVRKRSHCWESLADIVVATPGRLVDHINKTEGFDLTHLRFLILDEADKMMEEVKQDWLAEVEAAVFENHRCPGLPPLGGHRPRTRPGPFTPARLEAAEYPLQKLLCSATLSQNPEKLQQLNLFQPRLFTSVVKATAASETPTQEAPVKVGVKEKGTLLDAGGDELESGKTDEHGEASAGGCEDAAGNRGEFVGKFTTPAGLMEYFVECTAAEKPLIILHYLHSLKFRRVLCFTNSVEAAHRLSMVVKLVGNIEVREFSSNLHAIKRRKILRKFANGKVDLLICSDAMSRGMDVENVKYIISYDAPTYIKTYIHRVGRTARAGKAGMAVTLTEKKEIFHFKKMLRDVGKTGVQEMKMTRGVLKSLLPEFQKALEALPELLQREKEQKKRGQSRTPLGVKK